MLKSLVGTQSTIVIIRLIDKLHTLILYVQNATFIREHFLILNLSFGLFGFLFKDVSKNSCIIILRYSSVLERATDRTASHSSRSSSQGKGQLNDISIKFIILFY